MTRIGKERKEEIRYSIINEAKILFFTNGYDKTSTSEIAKAVGIAEGTIFNYFKTKAEIFLAVFTDEFLKETIEIDCFVDLNSGVLDIIFDFLNKNFKFLYMLPKGMLRDLGVAFLNIAKKSPKIVSKFAALDYKMMDFLCELIKDLQQKKLIIDCDARALTETIYSVVTFEFLIYIYEDVKTKEEMLRNLRQKIEIIIKGYVFEINK
ncbi:MAG: TetR/AcrR family transcriptional regulator [Clostridiales bacterium]